MSRGWHEHEPAPRPADCLRSELRPFSADEIDQARTPHPHAFADHEHGAFPRGEVALLASMQRAGKSHAVAAVAISFARGHAIGGMLPSGERRRVVILSAEDSRPDFCRKIAAGIHGIGDPERGDVLRRVLVPDLESTALAPLIQLATVIDGRPIAGALVDMAIEALADLRPGLVILETLSTLSDAGEDNRALSTAAAAAKRIARELDTSVIVTHHLSQAAMQNLPTLAISSADIRGGTALVANTRQSWMLVDLASEADPHPDSDARTLLRTMVARNVRERMSALICLDSSKCPDPAPIFLRWEVTPYGPRCVEHVAPSDVACLPWRRLHRQIRGARAEAVAESKAEGKHASVQQVLGIVEKLTAAGQPATARQVSVAAGRSATWATPYLATAVAEGLLIERLQKLPRAAGPVVVYSPSRAADEA